MAFLQICESRQSSIKSPLLYQLSYGLSVELASVADIEIARNSRKDERNGAGFVRAAGTGVVR